MHDVATHRQRIKTCLAWPSCNISPWAFCKGESAEHKIKMSGLFLIVTILAALAQQSSAEDCGLEIPPFEIFDYQAVKHAI